MNLQPAVYPCIDSVFRIDYETGPVRARAYDSDVGGLNFTLRPDDRTTARGVFLHLRLAGLSLDAAFECLVQCVEVHVDGELRRGVFQFVDTHPTTIETIRSLVTLYMLGLDRHSRAPGIASGA